MFALTVTEIGNARRGIGLRSVSKRPRSTRFQNAILAFCSITGLLFVWTLLSVYVFSPILLPSPMAVLREAIVMTQSGELQRNIAASMQRYVLGYAGGVLAGILLGAMAGRSVITRGLAVPIINLLRPLSPVALVPLVIVWFGIGELSKVLLVGYTTFLMLFFTTLAGVASTPVIRERAARSMGASSLEVIWHVVIPSSTAHVLTGMRVALSSAYMSVVAAELIAANSGIGFIIMSARFNLLTTRMFVGLAALGILGLLTDMILSRFISRYLKRFVGEEVQRVM